jgi:homocitrate synthase NifV
MALHLCGLRPCDHLFVLADLRRLFQTMGGGEVPDNKAVIGPGIFAVESGIHVDGLGKDPLLYEPFPPESVGAKRRIVMGPYSGRGSVRVKCVQLGLPCAPELVSKLLAQVRCLSLSLERALEDQEFITLHRQIYANRGATAAAG